MSARQEGVRVGRRAFWNGLRERRDRISATRPRHARTRPASASAGDGCLRTRI